MVQYSLHIQSISCQACHVSSQDDELKFLFSSQKENVTNNVCLYMSQVTFFHSLVGMLRSFSCAPQYFGNLVLSPTAHIPNKWMGK
jgi:hypothetical protein